MAIAIMSLRDVGQIERAILYVGFPAALVAQEAGETALQVLIERQSDIRPAIQRFGYSYGVREFCVIRS
jgi:hypothetical protein